MSGNTAKDSNSGPYNEPFPDGIDMTMVITFIRANKGEVPYIMKLSEAFREGNGVPKDNQQEMKWLLRAVEREDPEAMYRAGIMYLDGRGDKEDFKKGTELLSKASEKGHELAKEKMRELMSDKSIKLDPKSLEELKNKAKAGDESACMKLIRIYQEGVGVEPDYSETFRWAMEATKFNNPIAEEIVGLCYLGGYGVETDYTKAQEWFLKSEIHGSKNRSEHEKLLEKFKNKNIVKQSGKTENKENPVEESNKQPDYKLKPTSYNDDDYVDFSGCKYKPAADTGISFDDIIGMDEAKNEVMNLIVLPTKYPELYAKFKKKSGGGILLYGLPGTGKTMFVQAVATEINAKFFNIKCSDVISKWVGESEENIKELFDTARKCKRAIIFFDEFDSLGKERSSAENDHHNTVVNELLAQIQGFEKNKNTILLLAASNRPWDIDSALLRPGRFNRKIYIPLPDRETRIAIVKKQLTSVPVSDGIDYEEIGDFTDGFNCSDVVELCEQMKMNAITRAIRENSSNQTIKNDDVEYAKRKVRSSVTENDRMKIKEFERYSL